MIGYRLISPAREEAAEAAEFYDSSEPGLGLEFFEQLDSLIQRLRDFPLSGTPVSTRLRASHLKKFPYSVIYYLDEEVLVVIAVAHQSRRPGYWRSRIS